MRQFHSLLAIVFLTASHTGYASAPALGQAGTGDRAIPSDASFTIKLDWFVGGECPANQGNLFYFRIGEQTFSASTSEFARGTLRRISATGASGGKVNVRVARTAGCKSNPLPFVQVELKGSQNRPGSVILSETPERKDSVPPVARYIQHLNKTGACRDANQPNLVACAGSRTDGGRTINIVFLIVSEDGNRIAVPTSGIPIHARCEGTSDIAGCFVSEELANSVTVKTGIDPKRASSPEIRQIRLHLIEFAAKRQVK